MKEYEVVIGLEIHAELNSKSKVFCSCKNEYGAPANTLVCPVCLGLPGSLPNLNMRAVELAIMTGVVLGADINEYTVFERRNYFYPNLPKSYQITEYNMPICSGGGIKLDNGKFININRIHLEEDSGKIITGVDDYSYVDFNRSGVPLVEIVTEPMLNSADEAIEFISKLRDLLVFAGISDCRMEEGGLRFDVNMSVREKRFGELGTRVELKNLSSFKMVAKAIDYETNRQIRELNNGNPVRKETRIWNDELNRTYVLRDKEEIKDYRYFPDPDLKTLHITKEDIERITRTIPESKEIKIKKYSDLGLSENAISIITSEKKLSDYFEKVLLITNSPVETANWIMTDVLRILKEQNRLDVNQIISEENLAEIINLVLNGTISRPNSKILFDEVITSGKPASTLVKELGLEGVVEKEDLKEIINTEINSNPNIINEFRESPEEIINYLLGRIMNITSNKANPMVAREMIVDMLDK